MKILYLFFAMALAYFGWSYTAWEVTVGSGDESSRSLFSSEMRSFDGFPR